MRDEPLTETESEIETDPVCGMRVEDEQAREHDLAVVYEGRQYLFCGPSCRATFLHRPADYAVPGRTQP